MKRRDFIRYATAGCITTLGTGVTARWQAAQAQSADSVTIQSLGHTCFLFTGSDRRILVNPFRPLGCTTGYRPPQVASDLVMISSRLLDEGYTQGLPGNPRLLTDPGVYEFSGMQVQGIRTPHDDNGGRRFGFNVVWKWNQGGMNIVHMGGAAAPIGIEEQILIGRPDVLLLPVGGGPKAFTPEEAQATVRTLNPKIVIPTQYRTPAADANACDILPIDNFLSLMEGTPVQVGDDTLTVRRSDLPDSGPQIEVLSYLF